MKRKIFLLKIVIMICVLLICFSKNILALNNENIIENSGKIGVTYKGYIDKKGLSSWIANDGLVGTESKGIGLNGIRIKLANAPASAKIEYMVLRDLGKRKRMDKLDFGK